NLASDRTVIAVLQGAGDHGAEDRLEADLHLLRQRSNLLRDVIDADRAGAGEGAENQQVDLARGHLDRVCRCEWRVEHGEAPEARGPRAPTAWQPVIADEWHEGEQRGGEH